MTLPLCDSSTVLKTLIPNDFLDCCFEYQYYFVLGGVQIFSDVMIIPLSFIVQPSSFFFKISSTLLSSVLSSTVSISSLIVSTLSS